MIMGRRLGLPTLICILGLAACAPGTGGTANRCTAAFGTPALVFQLFFGRSIDPLGHPLGHASGHASGEVSDRDWDGFVDRVVTPALPDGFTVFDATGAWMNPHTGKTIQERTKVVVVALPDVPASAAAVQRIRTEYQADFHQELVGMTVAPGCASF